jgi:glycosyltransferase involved in cell wall biosynthesis
MIKVSVIIPVYNTEPYLKRCLDSVCNQTLKDIEIICINDGSTDNSLAVLECRAQEDSRIKLITLPFNKGAAVARNRGIQLASGEYLGFIDSDDYIDLDFYEKLYAKAIENGAEIVKGAELKIIHPDGHITVDKHNNKIRQNKIHFWTEYTSAIFNRKFIQKNDIYFPEGLLVGEDPCFIIQASILSKRVDVIDSAQYYYVRRENSLNSDIWNKEKIQSYIKYVNYIVEFAAKANLPKNDHQILLEWLLKDIQYTSTIKSMGNKEYEDLFAHLIDKMNAIVPRRIQILFDATVFVHTAAKTENRSGIYFAARNILQRLENDGRFLITLFLEIDNRLLREEVFQNDDLLRKFKIVCESYRTFHINRQRLIKNKYFSPEQYDVYLNVGHISKLNNGAGIIQFYILHDTIALLLDYYAGARRTWFWNFHNEVFTKNTYCFCVSNSCKADFLRFFTILDPAKMFVIPHATSREFKPEKNDGRLKEIIMRYNIPLEKLYIFSFCSLEPRKGLIFTVGCFLKFIEKNDIDNLCFWLGGGGNVPAFIALLESKFGDLFLKYKDRIIILGYVNDEDVGVLYSHALIFTYISEYEGFGVPPLEAMSCGVPVITSNTSSLPEVVGDDAITITPNNEEACIRAFEDLYFNANLREKYRKRGLARTKMFSWDKSVKMMADKIIEVCEAK